MSAIKQHGHSTAFALMVVLLLLAMASTEFDRRSARIARRAGPLAIVHQRMSGPTDLK